jgi:hypothetical protein
MVPGRISFLQADDILAIYFPVFPRTGARVFVYHSMPISTGATLAPASRKDQDPSCFYQKETWAA